jgi:MFS transporter, PPP family, 3-phenylpropionic acid transporter
MKQNVGLKFKVYYFLKFIGQGVLYPFLVMLLNSKGISGSALGLLLMIIPFGKVVLQPVSGYLCDLYRIHKSVLLVSVVLNFLGGLFMFFCPPVYGYYLAAIVIITLGETSADTLINTLAIDYLARSNSQTDFGRWRLWGAFGYMAGSFFLGFFVLDNTLKLVPLIFAVANILALSAAFYLPRASEKKPLDWLGGIKMVTHNRPYALLLLGMVFAGVSFSIIMNYYSVYMKGIGAASWIIGFGVALQTGVEILLSANTKAITDRFSLRAVYLLGYAVLPLRCFLYLISKNPVIGLAIQNLHGFYIFSAFIVGMIVLDMNLKPEWRSTGQAYYYSAFGGIGAMLGAFIAPLIFDKQGISVLWAVAAVIAFIGYVFVNLATKKLIPSEKQVPGL